MAMKSLRYGSLKLFVDHYGLSVPVRWPEVFGRKAPLEVEIGFGTGEYLFRLARSHPNHDFVGIEENVERIHKTLRVTPAMEAGISDHVWTLQEIAALVKDEAPAKRSPYKKKNSN